jgi:hypothetical protein
MAGGEVCFKLFNRVIESAQRVTPTDVPNFSQRECCFELPVLADAVGDDVYRNDKHSIIGKYDINFFGLVSIFIQKNVNGTWEDKAEITDNSYGISYPYGFAGNSDFSLVYVGFEADWQSILNGFGEGSYRFRFKEIDFSLNETETIYPFEFCLKTYTKERADKSVRFETYTKGITGDVDSDKDIWDYTIPAGISGGDGWFNQWRLPSSFFGYNKSSYDREFIRYANGQEVWLQDEQIESYTWNSGHYPAILHDYIKTNILQADTILVTDYNSNNPNVIKDKAVNAASNYEPNWQYNNKKAFVDVDFVQKYQNRRKKRC